MLLIILQVYITLYLLKSFAADGLNGSGLRLEKIGEFFQVLPAHFGEIA